MHPHNTTFPHASWAKREHTKRKNKKTGDDSRDDTSNPTKNAKRPN